MVMAMPHQELLMRSCTILDSLRADPIRFELRTIKHDVMRKKLYSAFLFYTLKKSLANSETHCRKMSKKYFDDFVNKREKVSFKLIRTR